MACPSLFPWCRFPHNAVYYREDGHDRHSVLQSRFSAGAVRAGYRQTDQAVYPPGCHSKGWTLDFRGLTAQDQALRGRVESGKRHI